MSFGSLLLAIYLFINAVKGLSALQATSEENSQKPMATVKS
jgi:hypothetical protein